ncbi:OLC1v1020592C1 [Oldenlandia corymbosa var. corymbosa]|uniref:OLC1v1020592C1 n=1 Tax=Oldenlandia corymbosa var. corymbosa TaxID=529605 RepID=A0AAV1EHA0_OLDCO|nr:OLC1v1020592C1 [Oldenlandia corymbosa var. corymbosa]
MVTKKAGLIGTCLIVVVIGVVGTVAFMKSRPTPDNNATNSSLKAVEAFCQNTEFKETCVKSISSATNSTNSTELINVGFQVTIKELKTAQEKTTALQKAATDPMTAEIFKTCQRLFDDSIEDLEQTLDRLNTFDKKDVLLLVDDVKTWLTGAATSQRTCFDSFQEMNRNEAAEQVKQLLKVGSELTTDLLGMVDQVTQFVETDDKPGSSRRLLGVNESDEENWRRRLSKIGGVTPQNLRPNVTVALDPSGKKYMNDLTIDGAIRQAPSKTFDPYVVYVKEGVYHENITIYKDKWNLVLIGDGPDKTIITAKKSNMSGCGPDGTLGCSTFDTPTVSK